MISQNWFVANTNLVRIVLWKSLFEIAFQPISTAGSDLLREALSFTQSQVGVMEIPEGSNGGADVEKYQASVSIHKGD